MKRLLFMHIKTKKCFLLFYNSAVSYRVTTLVCPVAASHPYVAVSTSVDTPHLVVSHPSIWWLQETRRSPRGGPPHPSRDRGWSNRLVFRTEATPRCALRSRATWNWWYCYHTGKQSKMYRNVTARFSLKASETSF